MSPTSSPSQVERRSFADAADALPRRSPHTSWRERRMGHTVILDTQGRMLRGLNGTGGIAWQLADGSKSVREIARVIADESNAEESRVLEDVVAFFEHLRRLSLLELR